MDREAFEQLVSAWLDEPERGELRARIEAAVRDDPELLVIWDDWRRVAEVLGRMPPVVQQVDWPRWSARVSAAVEADAAAVDGRLDALVGAPAAMERVDWARLHGRISAAVRRERASGVRRRVRWVVGATAGAAAAAAGLLLVLRAEPEAIDMPRGSVKVVLARPAALTEGTAIAKISAPAEVAAQPAEFFTVDPVSPARAGEVAGYF
jgi:hypothetical protein